MIRPFGACSLQRSNCRRDQFGRQALCAVFKPGEVDSHSRRRDRRDTVGEDVVFGPLVAEGVHKADQSELCSPVITLPKVAE